MDKNLLKEILMAAIKVIDEWQDEPAELESESTDFGEAVLRARAMIAGSTAANTVTFMQNLLAFYDKRGYLTASQIKAINSNYSIFIKQ